MPNDQDRVDPVKIVSMHHPQLSIKYDPMSATTVIALDDFAYVHIHYDYRYTDNASIRALADHIVSYLKGPTHE